MKKRALFVFFLALAGVSSAYLWQASTLLLDQSSHIYKPTREWTSTPESAGLIYENVTFLSADGIRLSGWFLPAHPLNETILFCHGNSRNISSDIDLVRILRRLGLNVFIFDYRGYGKSEGTPDEPGTYSDAEAAWKFLTETKRFSPGSIVVWGRSLGGAVAAELALRKNPKALILEGAFTSLAELAQEMHPQYPVRWFLKGRYDNLKKMPGIHCPVLLVHSREDQVVPIHHGRRLYGAANPPKEFLEITGPHGTLPVEPVYRDGLIDFINGLGGSKLAEAGRRA